jgi:hypothetical protein
MPDQPLGKRRCLIKPWSWKGPQSSSNMKSPSKNEKQGLLRSLTCLWRKLELWLSGKEREREREAATVGGMRMQSMRKPSVNWSNTMYSKGCSLECSGLFSLVQCCLFQWNVSSMDRQTTYDLAWRQGQSWALGHPLSLCPRRISVFVEWLDNNGRAFKGPKRELWDHVGFQKTQKRTMYKSQKVMREGLENMAHGIKVQWGEWARHS